MDLVQIGEIFNGSGTPLVRTDFADETGWERIKADISRPVDFSNPDNLDPGDDGYVPHVIAINDPAFEGVDAATLAEACSAGDMPRGYVLLADARSMNEATTGPEITVDYVDLSTFDPEDVELLDSFMGRSFRCLLSEVAAIETNLAISNLDFHDFAGRAEPDGVFRGFGHRA